MYFISVITEKTLHFSIVDHYLSLEMKLIIQHILCCRTTTIQGYTDRLVYDVSFEKSLNCSTVKQHTPWVT